MHNLSNSIISVITVVMTLIYKAQS